MQVRYWDSLAAKTEMVLAVSIALGNRRVSHPDDASLEGKRMHQTSIT